jgi:diaminopropionate ammonia-lyase
VVAGESGAAGLAGLLAVMDDADARQALALDASSRVLVIGSEGANDPAAWARIVGRMAQ